MKYKIEEYQNIIFITLSNSIGDSKLIAYYEKKSAKLNVGNSQTKRRMVKDIKK